MPIQSFKESHLEQIARSLADSATHRELSSLFQQCRIEEQGGQPKWERILNALRVRQQYDKCGNNVGAFIQTLLDPARFPGEPERHAKFCTGVNRVLSFSGLYVQTDGKLALVKKASTVLEAEERATNLKRTLIERNVHQDVLRFCRPELLTNNYFHAVFEATKSVADKVRKLSGSNSDGSRLVDEAFGIGASGYPRLTFNTLKTPTEKSEHTGLMNLMKGLFGAFRNTTAHAPKIHWPINERDALDVLTLASLIHRRLDSSIRTHVP